MDPNAVPSGTQTGVPCFLGQVPSQQQLFAQQCAAMQACWSAAYCYHQMPVAPPGWQPYSIPGVMGPPMVMPHYMAPWPSHPQMVPPMQCSAPQAAPSCCAPAAPTHTHGGCAPCPSVACSPDSHSPCAPIPAGPAASAHPTHQPQPEAAHSKQRATSPSPSHDSAATGGAPSFGGSAGGSPCDSVELALMSEAQAGELLASFDASDDGNDFIEKDLEALIQLPPTACCLAAAHTRPGVACRNPDGCGGAGVGAHAAAAQGGAARRRELRRSDSLMSSASGCDIGAAQQTPRALRARSGSKLRGAAARAKGAKAARAAAAAAASAARKEAAFAAAAAADASASCLSCGGDADVSCDAQGADSGAEEQERLLPMSLDSELSELLDVSRASGDDWGALLA